MSADEGMDAAARATEVGSAIKALDFETSHCRKRFRVARKGRHSTGDICRVLNAARLLVLFRI
jgi:hypothetical protein